MIPSKLKSVLKDAILHKEQVLLVGAPGICKTDIVIQVAKELDANLILSYPAVSDPTDYKGLPSKEGDHAVFLPFGETYQAINAKKLTIWFIDDLGQASESVQKALMHLLLGRRLNGHFLSDHVVFVGATNNIGQRAGVSGLLEPVKSRWDSIIHVDVSIDDWVAWAISNNMPIELIAFIRTRPELLSKFEPTRELVNSPSPRTWASIGRRLNRKIIDFELFAGAVGKGAATEFLAFLDLATNAPSLEEIIKNPDSAPIPIKPALQYLVISGLAHIANKKNMENIYKYLLRLPQSFRVTCMRDIHNKYYQLAQDKLEEILSTKAFLDWVINEGKDLILNTKG